MIEFEKYAKIKDKYCICYFGPLDEYLLQLNLLKESIKNKFTKIDLYFGCLDEKRFLLNCDSVLVRSKLIEERSNYAYIKELKFNGLIHPIEELLIESEIFDISLEIPVRNFETKKCVIVTKAEYPVISLNRNEIDKIKRKVISQGFEPVENESIDDAGLVVGAESFNLFKAASQGIRTELYPTGFGTRLYKMMFPSGTVMHI